jgi:hypothetical protein
VDCGGKNRWQGLAHRWFLDGSERIAADPTIVLQGLPCFRPDVGGYMFAEHRLGGIGKMAAIMAITTSVSGCAWQHWRQPAPAVSYGSIKDDPVVPARPRPVAAATIQPVKKAQVVATAPIVTASTAIPAPRPAPTPTADDSRLISTELLAEGRRLFGLGMVLEARKRLSAAMDGAPPEVLLTLARTFDAHYLSALRQPDAYPEMDRALAFYRKAAERGSEEALEDIARIEGARAPTGTSAPVSEEPRKQE